LKVAAIFKEAAILDSFSAYRSKRLPPAHAG
jgi:hypothetical protein